MHHFHIFFVGLWELRPQTPTRAPPLDPAGGFSFPDPLICPPLEKILRAPMSAPIVGGGIIKDDDCEIKTTARIGDGNRAFTFVLQ